MKKSLTEFNLLLTNHESQRLKFRELLHSDYDTWLEFCTHPNTFDFYTFINTLNPKERCDTWFERAFNRFKN